LTVGSPKVYTETRTREKKAEKQKVSDRENRPEWRKKKKQKTEKEPVVKMGPGLLNIGGDHQSQGKKKKTQLSCQKLRSRPRGLKR